MKLKAKKLLSVVCACAMMLAIVSTNAQAYSTVYENGSSNSSYNRTAARDYLNKYTRTPNTAYADFTSEGGDCTNFVSQMLRAGGMSMTARKSNPGDNSWYYYGSAWGKRTSTWTAANNFRTYWGVVNGSGYKHATAMYKYSAAELQNNSAAYKNLVSRCQIGDVIQFVNQSGVTVHSMGVQRVYYDNSVRKVTVSQHTSNNFYHLTDKIAAKTTGWVVLLKMSKNSSSASSISLNSLHGILTDTQLAETFDLDSTTRSQSIDTFSTETLEELYDELQNVTCTTEEKDAKRWNIVETVGTILDDRHDEMVATYGEEIVPDTVVTKELLLSFIEDQINMCQSTLQIPDEFDSEYIENDIGTISIEKEKQQDSQMLGKLQRFDSEVKENATDENAFLYWQTYWTEIRGEQMPSHYVSGN